MRSRNNHRVNAMDMHASESTDEYVHPIINSTVHSGPHCRFLHNSTAVGASNSMHRKVGIQTQRHACPCTTMAIGETALAVSATASPDAPTSMAATQTRRVDGMTNAVKVKLTNGCAFNFQSAVLQ